MCLQMTDTSLPISENLSDLEASRMRQRLEEYRGLLVGFHAITHSRL